MASERSLNGFLWLRGCVPDDCMVAGNPARIIRRGIGAGRFGRLPKAEPTEYEQKFEKVVRSLLRKVGR